MQMQIVLNITISQTYNCFTKGLILDCDVTDALAKFFQQSNAKTKRKRQERYVVS